MLREDFFKPIKSLDEIKSGDHLKVQPEHGPANRLENIAPGEIREFKYFLHNIPFDEHFLDITGGLRYHDDNRKPENAAGTVITSVDVKQGRVYRFNPSEN